MNNNSNNGNKSSKVQEASQDQRVRKDEAAAPKRKSGW